MARKPVTDLSAWPSLTLEGNLISPAMVAKIAMPKDDEETRQSYRIRKGLSIRDEISTAFRVGQSHFDAFRKLEKPSAEATRRFMREFLTETLGFDDIAPHEGAVSLLAGGRVAIVVTPPDEDKLDRKSPTLSTDRSRSAAFALQDYVNEQDDALWGLATNGTVLRLMRDNASLTRPAFIEADLSQIFTNEDAASFSILWLLFHRTRFGNTGAPATDCDLERWRDAGAKEGEASRDRLAGQVQLALKLLGSGFLEANPDLSKRLQSGEIPLTGWFNELLRLVYRLIFLMVAEDRNLLHSPKAPAAARKLYAEGYSLTALRALCTRGATWDRHHDRYEGVKILFRSLAAGESTLALPALGGLFAADQLPHLGTARLRNRAFMEALYRLSWLADEKKTGMVPVNWRAMETEELGSVYESLLQLQPQLGSDERSLLFASDAAEQRGNQRKITGSFYTPDPLVQSLLDTALDPVLDRIEAESDDPAKALLKLSIIDPACGSGHFLLAAARRIATRLARIRADGTPSTEDFRHALRDVARCCIHGVDRNPMAVELTKVALWIETVDPGLPLGFFDAQIRCGDALLGVFDLKVLQHGIPDAAYKPLTGDDKDTAKYYAQANKGAKAGQGEFDFGTGQAQMPDTKPLAADFSGFRDLPEENVEQIGAKAKRFESLRKGQDYARTQAACDLYLAAFLMPKTGGAPTELSSRTVPTTEELWLTLNQGEIRPAMEAAPAIARRARAFHWPLEFPDVMQRGGFDVVLGNPPWERIKLQEQEFFASRSPEIASAPNKAARDRLIQALANASECSLERKQHDDFIAAKREAEATSEFTRITEESGGRYPLTGTGDSNTYALFTEHAVNLIDKGGSVGIVVPAGLMTDSKTKELFYSLFIAGRIESFRCFDNSLPIFPAIHRDTPFGLLTLQRENGTLEFCVEAKSIEEASDLRRRFTLSCDDLDLLNCNTRTAPTFRSQADAVIAKKIYNHVPAFIVEQPGRQLNAWGAKLFRMFDSAQDSGLFNEKPRFIAEGFVRCGLEWRQKGLCADRAQYYPLYEGKMIGLYDHRSGSFEDRTARPPRGASIPDPSPDEKANHDFEVEPWYWVERNLVTQKLADLNWSRKWSFGYRFGANPTNIRTVTCSAIPISATPHVFPQVIPNDDLSNECIVSLLANLNSLIVDYICRLKMSRQGLDAFIIKQLPILPPTFYTASRLDFIVPKVLELTYTSHSLAPFANDLGYDGPPFAWDEDHRAMLCAELDAFYARAYGLDRDELRYILDPADVKGPDYPSETFRVLKEKEIRKHGEYRTRRLVLEAWDRMMEDGTFVVLDLVAGQRIPVSSILPNLVDLSNGFWKWDPKTTREDRLRVAAQYALWISDSDQDASRLRILIACLAEPALLTNALPTQERREWERLCGQEARPLPTGVTRMHPETNAAWRAVFNRLITSGQLEENENADWLRGVHFNATGLDVGSPRGQQAAFALQALRGIEQARLSTLIPAEDQFVFARLAYGT